MLIIVIANNGFPRIVGIIFIDERQKQTKKLGTLRAFFTVCLKELLILDGYSLFIT
jgi:hypothetical protein